MKKENIASLVREQNFEEKIKLDDLPEIDLYMDQVIQLFENSLSNMKRNEEDKVLTKTMINNYAKAKLLMKINNKKYSKDHLILMSLIYELKGALSINDIKLLLDSIVSKYDNGEEYDVRKLYSSYLNICDDESEFTKKHLIEKLDTVFKGKQDEELTYEEKFLLISTVVSMSNIYRRMAETLIDNFFAKGEE